MGTNPSQGGAVLNPVGDVRVVQGKLAPRLPSLEGKTVIFMDDNVGPQEPFWKRLGMRIEESFTGCKTVDRISRGSEPLPMNEIEEIADRADAVVVGIALWGSCTSRSVQDAVRVQNKGVPAVIVAYGEFERAARNQLKLMGLPDQPVIVLPGLRVGGTAESADIAFEAIAGALVEKVPQKPIA